MLAGPEAVSTGSSTSCDSRPNVTPLMRPSSRTLPSTRVAPSMSCCPSRMEQMDAPPMPTSRTSAKVRFMTGNVIARPEMASGPTPVPDKNTVDDVVKGKDHHAAMAGKE